MSKLYIKNITNCYDCGHCYLKKYTITFKCGLSDKIIYVDNIYRNIPKWCKLEDAEK